MINEERLRRMKRTALLANTARGGSGYRSSS
jgi:phosphoglycerate dehydrogenase-like enzyme